MKRPGKIGFVAALLCWSAGMPVSARDDASTYMVRQGDSLSAIAGRFYDNNGLWPLILDANTDMLHGDPKRVAPGMRLTIPQIGYRRGVSKSKPPASVETTGIQWAEGPGSWVYSEGIARAVRRDYLTFENAGRIAYLDPDLKEGDTVRKGHVIAYQDQRRSRSGIATAEAQIVQGQAQIAAAQATLKQARANLHLAQQTFERFSVLLQQNSASKQEYDQAQAQLESARATVQSAATQIAIARAQVGVAKANRATASVIKDESALVAPITGVIARINIREGNYYAPTQINTSTEQSLFDTVPAIMIDPSRYEISYNAPYNLLKVLKVGAPVMIEVIEPDATLEERLPDEAEGPPKPVSSYKIAGAVYAISPVFDADLQNFLVKIRTTQGHEQLRDGATVALWIRKSRP